MSARLPNLLGHFRGDLSELFAPHGDIEPFIPIQSPSLSISAVKIQLKTRKYHKASKAFLASYLIFFCPLFFTNHIIQQ